jgi:hypothetical protein
MRERRAVVADALECAMNWNDTAPPPSSKWYRHPNLRKRPPSPAKNRGRLQVQIRRAFIATGSDMLTSTVVYDWAYPRRRPGQMPLGLYWSVLRILRVVAVPVGRAPTIGRPILWRLREPLDER